MSVELQAIRLPLADFELEIDTRLIARTTAICGPSGSGKTTLLEVIAGLRKPVSGVVRIAGRVVFDAVQPVDTPPRERRVGYVPQDDALFPHLSVRGNVLYGANRNTAGPFTIEHVQSVLEIDHIAKRGVERLSGGERKRVALARALLSRPEILLLDEPLAGVHPELRARILDYLMRVREEFALPIIYVTHEVAEAAMLCDEIVTMDRGRITARA